MGEIFSEIWPSSQISADSGTSSQHLSQPFSETYTIYDDDDDDGFWILLDMLRDELVRKQFLPPKPRCYSKIRMETNNLRVEDVKQTLIYYISELQKKENFPIGVINRRCWSNTQVDELNGLSFHNNEKNYKFIGVRHSGQLLTVMCRILDTMTKNSKITKRDLFYKDKDLYKTQRVCDQLIEEVCCFTKIPRRSLCILACSKGLVFGNLYLTVEGKTEDCLTFPSGYPLPYDIESIEEIRSSSAKFILVVEKDASFQHLIGSKIVERFPMVIITAKGFPDFTTRKFVKICAESLSIPVLALFDCDPWGIEIACVYKYGSLAGAHDFSKVPGIKWLGVLPTDIVSDHWNICEKNVSELNEMDKKKLNDLLKRNYIRGNEKWKKQIQIMKDRNVKSELQQTDQVKEGFLITEYLPYKIRHGLWV